MEKQFDVRLFMQRTVFRYMILVEDGFFHELLWVSLHLPHPLQKIPAAPFSVELFNQGISLNRWSRKQYPCWNPVLLMYWLSLPHHSLSRPGKRKCLTLHLVCNWRIITILILISSNPQNNTMIGWENQIISHPFLKTLV